MLLFRIVGVRVRFFRVYILACEYVNLDETKWATIAH